MKSIVESVILKEAESESDIAANLLHSIPLYQPANINNNDYDAGYEADDEESYVTDSD